LFAMHPDEPSPTSTIAILFLNAFAHYFGCAQYKGLCY